MSVEDDEPPAAAARVEMTPEVAAALRAPFPPEAVGKLPRVWCGKCREANKQRRPTCDEHQKARCRECGNNITTAHLHLDYVGHAEITDRLLEADPYWFWEPFVLDQNGLPARDQHGGMWIRLTVAGVTRIGYGDAEGKEGPAATKEVIGDALRNAAMRFGVGLDLWGATYKGSDDDATATPAASHTRPDQHHGNDHQQRDPVSQARAEAWAEAQKLNMTMEGFAKDFHGFAKVPVQEGTAAQFKAHAKHLRESSIAAAGAR